MTFDVTLDIEPMTLDVEMGEIYDVTGDEFERGYSEGYEVGVGSVAAGMVTSYKSDRIAQVRSYAFYGCSQLTSVDFSLKVTIGASAFDDCTQLTTLILRANEVCNLSSTSAFTYTPIKSGTGYIYVPNDLVDSYKAATNWSTYAAQIKPLSELEG